MSNHRLLFCNLHYCVLYLCFCALLYVLLYLCFCALFSCLWDGGLPKPQNGNMTTYPRCHAAPAPLYFQCAWCHMFEIQNPVFRTVWLNHVAKHIHLVRISHVEIIRITYYKLGKRFKAERRPWSKYTPIFTPHPGQWHVSNIFVTHKSNLKDMQLDATW